MDPTTGSDTNVRVTLTASTSPPPPSSIVLMTQLVTPTRPKPAYRFEPCRLTRHAWRSHDGYAAAPPWTGRCYPARSIIARARSPILRRISAIPTVRLMALDLVAPLA